MLEVNLELHRRFKEDRLWGEWFKPTDRLLKFIERNASNVW
jgi:hypothetical protein